MQYGSSSILFLRSYDQFNFLKLKLIKCQAQKVKYQQKDLNTRDTHVKYNTKAVALTIQKLLAKLKFLKSWSKVKGQGHKVKIVCFQEKALSHKIFM